MTHDSSPAPEDGAPSAGPRTAPLLAMVVVAQPPARDELVFLLGELGVDVVAQAAGSAEALRVFTSAEPDVVFVDLRMPGPDGLALAEALRARVREVPIVVVSAHDEGALRGYEVGVVDYVLKPVRLERLRQAVDRVRARWVEPSSSGTSSASSTGAGTAPLTRLAVRRRNAYVVVDIDEVVYLEMKDELVWAVTREDRFALDLTLSVLEERLPDVFFRSHRGYIVRVDRIVAIEPAGAGTFDLVMDHPAKPKVPLARERARVLRERIPIAG